MKHVIFPFSIFLSLLLYTGGVEAGHLVTGMLWEEKGINSTDILPSFAFLQTETHKKCHARLSECLTCTQECSFQSQNRYRERLMNSSIAVQGCHQKLSQFRPRLPSWCQIDGSGINSKPGYVPHSKKCDKMDVVKCVQTWFREGRGDTRAVRKMVNDYAILLAGLQKQKTEMERLSRLRHEYREEKRKRLLEQAKEHMRRLDENRTIYADTLYHGIYEIAHENNNLDMMISRTDVYSAKMENKFVRMETVDKVPRLVSGILQLKNRIHSRKHETESYLTDIRSIAKNTIILQETAANVLYETTHEDDVDKEVAILDKELFKLHAELKEERAVLDRAHTKATFTKMRLVGGLRQLVWDVSRTQSRSGCAAQELMTFMESSDKSN